MTATENAQLQTRKLLEKYDYLAPDGSEIRLLAEVNGGGLCHCTLPAGAVAAAVSHKTVEEIWYFLSGEGELWRKRGEEEAMAEVRAGVSVAIPVGTVFQFRNVGHGPLRFIIATIPRWPGEEEAVPATGIWQPEAEASGG